MSVKELIAELSKYDQDAKVNIEMCINGIEYDAIIDETYYSGDIYIYGNFGEYNKEGDK